jgi:predicted site-specific integrase-resolvase
LYGPVSGHGQKEDLDTHLQRLQAWAAPERRGQERLVLSDIGSGLKASRRQLQRLLKLVCADKVAEVALRMRTASPALGKNISNCSLSVLPHLNGA